jgi:hypothetical protein
VTLATATEQNSITVTSPLYGIDDPVKLLNFNWYSDSWQIGIIRGWGPEATGFGFFLNGAEKCRFKYDGLSISGLLATQSISVSGGSPSAGKVLTATNASGNCTWQTPSVYANDVKPITYNVTGTFTISSYPHNSVIYVYSSSDVTVTLPSGGGGLVETWNEGETRTVCRAGTGNVTFVQNPTTPVPISSINNYTKIGDQNTMVAVTLHYDGNGNPHFFLVGNLSN